MDDISDIRSYYDSALNEEERLGRHQLEWDLTWRYLDEYLPARGRILEVGAATGRYTRELARRGYRVTAADLSPILTEWSRARCTEEGLGGSVRHLVADARDLSALAGETFDAALVMGPLYHLAHRQDRLAALREAGRLLPVGGLLVTTHIARLGILGDLLRTVPEWALTAEPPSILAEGRDPQGPHEGGFRAYFARAEELAPLHEEAGFETLVVAAAEPAISADDESYNRLEGELRRAWLDLLYQVSAEPSIVGASRHLLVIGRKRGG